VRIRLLGGFTVEVGGTDVAARPWRLRKSRTLVKVLALAPEQRMHRDQLLELLWPDRGAAAAANNLHQALHVARRELAGEFPDQAVLVIRDGLVQLHADAAVDTDVRQFRRLAARGWSTRAVDDLAAAIDAYAGDLLPEDRFEDWAGGPREDLRQAFCDLLVAHADACTAAGDAGAAAESLRRALEVDPLHEAAVRGLMRAMAAQGRRSEALALYERLRRNLSDAYGGDPDPRSRRLYRDLLAGAVDTAAPTGPPPPRTNLRHALTSFIGRERQIGDVRRELARARLVTLTGPGGVGKTRLAAEALRGLLDRYADGVWVVDLVPVATPERLPDAVADAMGLDRSAGGDPVRTLAGRLAARRVLLLLDNCEHLVDACAHLVRRLLSECPELRVLATSREPLHVPGEVTLRVPSLAVPARGEESTTAPTHEAVRLLVDRARLVRPGFRLAESNLPAVVEICRRLDGVPLAIELAAARLAHLEPAEIAERLGNALTVLGSGDQMTRNATLRATLGWSHDLLTGAEQVLLRRLSVFAGSFSLAAVEGVCAGEPLAPPVILDLLGRLVDKSMVQVERSGQRSRYRLLETLRQFGAERLVAAGERAPVQAAHRRYFLRLALDHDPDRGHAVDFRPQALDEEHDNLRAALGRALRSEPGEALLLAVSLWRFWLARGHFAEGSRWLHQALSAAPDSPHPERSRALLALAVLEARLGRSARFSELGAAAVTAAQATGSPVQVAFTRMRAGFLHMLAGDVRRAADVADRGLIDARALDHAPVAAVARWLRSLTDLFREDAPAALDRLDETLAALAAVDPQAPPFLPAVRIPLVLIPCGMRWVPAFEETALIGSLGGREQATGYALSALGSAHRLARDLRSAAAACRRSVEVFSGLGDEAGLALVLHQLGCVERDLGAAEAARTHLEQALELRRRLGDRRGESLTLANLGLADAAAGNVDRARRLARLALTQCEEVEDGPAVAGGLLDLALVELFAGEVGLGRGLAEQAVEAFRPQGYPSLTAWASQLVAELAAAGGARDAARRHGTEAAALFARAGCRIGAARAAELAAKGG
jgi:predicted ATPase/DNA-binding SARP family transcriptional activator